MTYELKRIVLESQFEPSVIAARTEGIYRQAIQLSPNISHGNFDRFHPGDLRRLFEMYDQVFFKGACRRRLGAQGINFRISKRMFSSGGKTTRYRGRDGSEHYEICVASTLLFKTFTENDHRPISVTGIVCTDRLQALQRVLEHELVHLLEMMVWTRSNCKVARFQGAAERIFGHREHTHRLITPREQAAVKFGVRPGVWVRFEYQGMQYSGLVNRVTKRATVLIPSPQGQLYSDGQRYEVSYVPVSWLTPIERPASGRELA
jgi:hypothetical protein